METTSRQQHAICAITRPARSLRIAGEDPVVSRRSTPAGSSCRISTSGRRPHATVAAAHTTDAVRIPTTSGTKTNCSASCSNRNAGTIRAVHTASSPPKTAPTPEITIPSASNCLASWPRLAPSAIRTDVSCDRAEARERRNVATLAHAIRNTAPAATGSRVPIRDMPAAESGVIPL